MRRKFKWSSKLLPKGSKRADRSSGTQNSPELKKIQKNIYRQAALAGLTIVLTIVILFAMTSAWYTNIVQTSGLMFEAEPWGFDGEILVDDAPIQAAPGDEGVVAMTVKSKSDSMSTLSVNVSKAETDVEMQKRLFLYVDTHATREGETMDRVYINNFEGYNYTVFGNGQLTLTEQISNAPRIKWQWVYDMLGYYVMANPIKGETGAVLYMNIQDYLRPIEYDYDAATIMEYTDSDGNHQASITAMEGMDRDTFLVNFSKKDGYKGQIDPDKYVEAGGKRYYPVEVDNQGNGVYAYLCDYSEVEQATEFDTDLGEQAYKLAHDETLTDEEKAALRAELRHTLKLTISAQNSDSTVVSVSTVSGLQNAITNGYGDVVQLSDDITLTGGSEGTLTIPAGTRTTIDLNGHVITGTNSTGAIIKAEQGSSLTLTNGNMNGPAANTGKVYAVETTGAEVIMSKVNTSGFDVGVYMGDQATGNELDSRVHLMNCIIDSEWYGVYINGNGTNSAQKTQLIIEDSTVSGDGYGITGSGNSDRLGTDIQIRNSKILQKPENGGTGAAIFHPQADSTLTIADGSTIEGYTGIALKAGHVSISDSTVTGFGPTSLDPEQYASKSGFADTADAVYIETNYGHDIRLDISGESKLTSSAGKSLRVYEEAATNVVVQIVSGTFDQAPLETYIAEGSVLDGNNVKVKE